MRSQNASDFILTWNFNKTLLRVECFFSFENRHFVRHWVWKYFNYLFSNPWGRPWFFPWHSHLFSWHLPGRLRQPVCWIKQRFGHRWYSLTVRCRHYRLMRSLQYDSQSCFAYPVCGEPRCHLFRKGQHRLFCPFSISIRFSLARKLKSCQHLAPCVFTTIDLRLDHKVIDDASFDSKIYKKGTGSFMYFMKFTRPEIAFAVGRPSQFTVKPPVGFCVSVKMCYQMFMWIRNVWHILFFETQISYCTGSVEQIRLGWLQAE